MYCFLPGILNLPWEDLQGEVSLKQLVVPDLVVAADLVYDSCVFTALCAAFRYFLRTNTNCQIIFVCAVRNVDTLTEFLKLLGKCYNQLYYHLLESLPHC